MNIDRMIRSFLIFLILQLPYLIQSQPVSISGMIPGARSAEINILSIADYISSRREIVKTTETDENGSFECIVEVSETRLLWLEIGHYSFYFFAEPAGNYRIGADSIDLDHEFRPFYNLDPLPASLISEPQPGLNRIIGEFNRAYDDFVIREFSGIYQRRNPSILESLRQEAAALLSNIEHPFLHQYIDYRIASLELVIAPASRGKLFRTWIDDRPVLLNNPGYMDFFNKFFEDYLYPANRFIPRSDLYSTVNVRPDLPALLDTLGKDTTLRNEVIRELVCLKGLREFNYSADFSRTNVQDLLRDFQNRSKFAAHRVMAGNLLAELTFLQKGTYPPSFELEGLDGKSARLQDLKGRPVYLSFFTTWSSGCLTELKLMKNLYDEYNEKIMFVSISLDKDIQTVRKFRQDKGYDWDFLFNGEDFDLIFNYRIKTFPVFILLDSSGKVYEYPAYKPSEVIREQFDRLLENP